MTLIYTQEDMDKALNNCRIQERYNAWTVMANFGIPAERIPQIYKESRDIVITLVNAPAKKDVADGGSPPP